MGAHTRLLRGFTVGLFFGFFACPSSGDDLSPEMRVRYEKSVVVSVTSPNTFYKPGEEVPLVVTIVNRGSDPLYLETDEPGIFHGSIRVRDVKGTEVMGDAIPSPPQPPASHFMAKDDKRTFVVPLSKIEGFGTIALLKRDGLDRYHRHLSEGIYELDPGYMETIHEPSNVIVREDVSHRLWVEPSSPKVTIRHKLNAVKIEIRGKLEDEVPPRLETRPEPERQPSPIEAPQARIKHEPKPAVVTEHGRILRLFIGGVAVVMCALLPVLLLRRRRGGH